jgi:K+-transporting ATPase ATPase C chain
MQHWKPAILGVLVFTLFTGLIYPLVVTGIAQLLFPHRANGSLIEVNGRVRGSELIGQSFDRPEYFWGRLSATAPAFNATASSGSNLGPMNAALLESARGRIDALRNADPGATAPIPVDLVTASGSGLDPHISIAAALWQLPRVARARRLDPARVRALVDRHTEGRTLGLLGEPRVNVLLLNLALDAAQPAVTAHRE